MQHPVEVSVEIAGAKATFRTLSRRTAEVDVALNIPTVRAGRKEGIALAVERMLAADLLLLQEKFRDLSRKLVAALNQQGSGASMRSAAGPDIDRPWEVNSTHIVVKELQLQTCMSTTFIDDDIAESAAAAALLEALRQSEVLVIQRSYATILRKALSAEN